MNMDFNAMDDYDKALYLEHYGTPRHSGRYPWGSGGNPYQSTKTFHATYNELHNAGLTDKQIAEQLNCTINELRLKRSISSAQEKAENVTRATRMREHGYTASEIGRKMGVNESTVRGWLKDGFKERITAAKTTSEEIKDNMKSKGGYLDISVGVEREIGISRPKLDAAIKMLVDSGEYEVKTVSIKQITMPGQFTNTKILVPKGTTRQEINENFGDIRSFNEYTPDGGKEYWAPQYPREIARNRIGVRYNEEGGVDKDGVIELRRGLKDITLENSTYAQVRIAIEGGMYAKGMAVYSDNLPDGVDILVNTNRHVGAPDLDVKENGTFKEGVFKKIKDEADADAAFGAKIKPNGQSYYEDENGNKQLGYINKVNEEGDWEKWSKTLSSQFLSKQPIELINKQLDLTYANNVQEYEEIMSLTNPAVKKQLLETFAGQCDGAAVDLKAASLPRQQQHVILPLTTIGDKEIYAPNYNDGEEVVLIRYPHAGTFELVQLRVNNKNAEGKSVLGTNPIDAVGISKNSADKLSGADFDGDTVAVIPINDKVRIKVTETLEGLKGFDGKESYPYVEGMKILEKKNTGMEMGKVSNLITDMTLKNATPDEIACAVRHSMVIIDAAKHKLNYKQSEIDNHIAALKAKYQGGPTNGASTLISRASSQAHIAERELARVDEETGELVKSWKPSSDGKLIYKETGRQYKSYVKDKNGNQVYDEDGNPVYKMKTATIKVKKMSIVEDAHELSSGTLKEDAYADYANQMKALGNQARKEALAIKPQPKSKTAETLYKAEVDSLNAKLDTALRNAPKERQAQVIANVAMNRILEEHDSMDKEEIKKISQVQMARARAQVGANKKDVQINVTPKEWEAIQAGALSTSKQQMILKNCDLDIIRKYATPAKNSTKVSNAQINSIKSFANAGFTNAEIAERLGLSTSTISKYLK